MTLKITRKLRDHPLPSPTPDLLPFVYPTLEKRHLQSPRPSDTCLGQNPLFEKVFPRTVNPDSVVLQRPGTRTQNRRSDSKKEAAQSQSFLQPPKTSAVSGADDCEQHQDGLGKSFHATEAPG